MIFNKDNYNIDIQIIKSDTGKDIIRIHDERNDFVGKCRLDEADEFIKFLNWMEDYETYDGDCDEYITPDELELYEAAQDYRYAEDGYEFDDEVLYGNWVLLDRIYYIQEAIKEFMASTFSIDEVIKEGNDIENLKNKLKQHDISTLMFMLKRIEQPQHRPVEVD